RARWLAARGAAERPMEEASAHMRTRPRRGEMEFMDRGERETGWHRGPARERTEETNDASDPRWLQRWTLSADRYREAMIAAQGLSCTVKVTYGENVQEVFRTPSVFGRGEGGRRLRIRRQTQKQSRGRA